MAGVVDLTISSDEEQEDLEAVQRKRIMVFAAQQQQSNKRPKIAVPAPAKPAEADEPSQGDDVAAPSSSVPNSLLARLHEERRQRQQQAGAAAAGPSSSDGSDKPVRNGQPAGKAAASPISGQQGDASGTDATRQVSILSYNVWFREDVALQERMNALGKSIADSNYPNFLCFQEVTPLIVTLWRTAPWWQHYVVPAVPLDRSYFTLLMAHRDKAPTAGIAFKEMAFPNSIMGRSLMSMDVPFGSGAQRLIVATSHLESPVPPNFYSAERKQQLAAAVRGLDGSGAPNVVMVGDMNWTDSRDGAPALTAGWQDVWRQLRPKEEGLTYDTASNPMLFGSWKGSRLDRCFAKLRDFRAVSIEMLGTQALPGVTYEHTFRNGGRKRLPVLPSDHYGLLIKLEPV